MMSTAQAAIAFKQINSAVPQTPQTTVNVSFGAAQSAGSLNVVAVGWFNTTAHVLSVTDSRGNNYVLAAGPTTQAQAGTQAMYYAANIVAGTNTVTVTFDAAVPYPDVRIAEYSGIDLFNAFDVAISGTGTGATSNSGSVTTTNANDLLVGANYVTTHSDRSGHGLHTAGDHRSERFDPGGSGGDGDRQLQRYGAADRWQLDHADGGVPRG